jgi:hypothetical protein
MSLYKTYKSGEEKFDNKVNEIKQYQPFENDDENTVFEFGYKVRRGNEHFKIIDFGNLKQFRKQEYISIIKGEMERLGLVKKKLNHHTCVGEANGYNEPCGECVIITSYNQAISDQISHLQSELLLIEKDNG